MNASNEALEALNKSDSFKKLLDNRQVMMSFFSHEGWETFTDWLRVTEDAYRDIALDHPDPKEREEARLRRLALRDFRALPKFLSDLLEENPKPPAQAG